MLTLVKGDTIEESEDLKAKCPTCDAIIPMDAKECPNCGEIFEPEAIEATTEEATEDVVEEEVSPTGRMGKVLFYVSIVLILLGGPGMALGSWLHDILRIPIIGDTYEAFGWMNKMFASVGLLILIIGIILLILSLRRTTVVVEEYDLSFEGKEEGEEAASE